MFINKFGDIDWNKMIIAFSAVLVFVIFGFAGLDMLLLPYFRMMNLGLWNWVSFFGKWSVLLVASIAAFVAIKVMIDLDPKLGGILRYTKLRTLFGNMVVSIVGAIFVTGVLKVIIGRMRPIMFEALAVTEFRPFSLSDTFHSFPSGHGTAVFAIMMSVGLLYPRFARAALVFATIIAASRVMTGAHWPSDVVMGAFIGIASANLVVWAKKRYFS